MKLMLFTTILLVLCACSPQEVCDEEPESVLVARLKTLVGQIPGDTVLTGLSVYGIREGMEDSLLYDSQSASRIFLPLNPAGSSTDFVLSTPDGQDTLSIMHGTSFYLVSYSCGFGTLFNLESLSHSGTLIKGLEVVKNEVDAKMETDEEHIWIYF